MTVTIDGTSLALLITWFILTTLFVVAMAMHAHRQEKKVHQLEIKIESMWEVYLKQYVFPQKPPEPDRTMPWQLSELSGPPEEASSQG